MTLTDWLNHRVYLTVPSHCYFFSMAPLEADMHLPANYGGARLANRFIVEQGGIRMNFPTSRTGIIGFVLCAAVACVSLASAELPPPKPGTVKPVVKPSAKKPSPVKPAVADPVALNDKFWGDWNETKSSDDFAKLNAAVSCADKSATALAARKSDEPQRVVNIAISKPEDAAKVLSDASAASNDSVSANALATVVNMVISPKTRIDAAPLVAPEAQKRVNAMTANLSTGIQGLPGIYLGDNSGVSGGSRPDIPAGYTPVSGGTQGCRAR